MGLELLVLVLVERGHNTPYALKEAGGISLGAAVPALRRLEKTGDVGHTAAGRRHEFALTASGRKRLNTSWEKELRQYTSSDYDGVLRDAFLYLLLAPSPKRSVDYLREAAAARRRVAADQRRVAARLEGELDTDPLTAYGWMRALSQRSRAAAEATTLVTIAKTLERRSRKPSG